MKIGTVSVAPLAFANSSHSVVMAKGKEIAPYIGQIIDLHLAVYQEQPFFFEGTHEEYAPYIQMFADSEEAVACMAFDQGRMVGAIIGLPMKELPETWSKSYQEATDRVYYLGDATILEKYRRKHLGSDLYRQFEKAIPSGYDTLSFIRLDDPAEHPFNALLKNRGAIELDKAIEYPWRDIRTKEIPLHKLIYWNKPI